MEMLLLATKEIPLLEGLAIMLLKGLGLWVTTEMPLLEGLATMLLEGLGIVGNHGDAATGRIGDCRQLWRCCYWKDSSCCSLFALRYPVSNKRRV
jgi:hypothetical protein